MRYLLTILLLSLPLTAQINNGGGGGGSGTVSANSTAAGAVANYAAAAGSTTVGPTTLNYVAPTLTVSTAAGGSGSIALSGNTSGTATITAPAVAGTATNPIVISNSVTLPVGGIGLCSICWSGDTTTGIKGGNPAGDTLFLDAGTLEYAFSSRLTGNSVSAYGWSNNATDPTSALDTNLNRGAAGQVNVGTTALNSSGIIKALRHDTDTNCASSGGTCGSASSGSVSIAAAASTVTVATTSVTANSVILLTRDDTLGTKLTVTCNTATAAGDIKVSTRTAGTSFVITVQNSPATNPLCLNYVILN